MPQACHGALEMGSGLAKASCKSGFECLRPFTRHHSAMRRRAMAITPSSPANTMAQLPGSGTAGAGASLALAMRENFSVSRSLQPFAATRTPCGCDAPTSSWRLNTARRLNSVPYLVLLPGVKSYTQVVEMTRDLVDGEASALIV